jgi:MFS family permease
MFVTFSLVFGFESPFFRELGAPPVVIGMMGSVGAAALSLVRIPGAYIADKYGRKQIIATMTFVIAFSQLLYIFAPDWRFVLIGVIISNFSLVYQPALEAIEADSIPPEKRGMGYAAINVIPNIPTIVAPAIAGFLVSTQGIVQGMRVVYAIVFFCMLAAALIRLFFLRETLRESKKIRLGEIKTAFKESLGAIAEAWRSMSTSLKFLTVAFLISAFEEPMFHTFTSLYVFDIVRISEIEWGLANVGFFATTIIFGFPLGKLVDKIERKKAAILAYFALIPSTVLFVFSRSLTQLFIARIMLAIGFSLFWPAYNALQADMIPREKRGRIMGTIGTLNILATIPASAVGGILYSLDPASPFILTIVLGAIVSFTVFFGVKEPKTREK